MNKRITIISDPPNWALYFIYKYIETELQKQIRIAYIPYSEIWNIRSLLPLLTSFYYVNYTFLLDAIPWPLHRMIMGIGIQCHWEFCDTTSVESVLRTADKPSSTFVKKINRYPQLAVPSEGLLKIMKRYHPGTMLVPYGVDPTLFFPCKEAGNQTNDLRIGWAQSETNHRFKRRIKTIEQVISSIPGTKLAKIQEELGKVIDRHLMNRWYNSLDVYICYSLCEGGPMPVLEAMACGVPCISSPVGHVPELIEHGKNGLIIHSAEEMKSAISFLKEHPEKRRAMGAEARRTVLEKRTPATIAPYWISFLRGSQ